MATKALKTLVVDDESFARRILLEELSLVDGITVVGEAENGKHALQQIENLVPDLVLLDVQMPVMDGFEVVRRLGGPLPSIIFVTAYSEHAIQAFEISAIAYLLKPIAEKRLHTALERAREPRRRPLGGAQRVAATLNALGPEPSIGSSKTVVRRGQDYYLLNLDEIFAFQAEGEIVWAHAEKRKYRATQNLRTLEQRLPISARPSRRSAQHGQDSENA